MSFKDEVNSRLRTPEQIWIENAKSDYSGIKSQILSMAHAGKFVNVAGKRMIEIDYQGMVKNLFKHDYVIKGIKGTLFSPGGGYTSSAFILQNHSAYDAYLRTLKELAKQDGITVEIIGRWKKYNRPDYYFKIPGKIEANDYSIMQSDTAVVIRCTMYI